MKLILVFGLGFILSCCTWNRKKCITVNIPDKSCCLIYIIPDKNSSNTSNQFQVDSTGIHVLNYYYSAKFHDYDLKIIRNNEDITDQCTFSNVSLSPRGKNTSGLDIKEITLPECVRSIKNGKQIESVHLKKKIGGV